MFSWIQSLFKNPGNEQPEIAENGKTNHTPPPTEPAGTQQSSDLNQVIQLEAYYLWEQDGKPEGKADYYWQKASEIVLNSQRR